MIDLKKSSLLNHNAKIINHYNFTLNKNFILMSKNKTYCFFFRNILKPNLDFLVFYTSNKAIKKSRVLCLL